MTLDIPEAGAEPVPASVALAWIVIVVPRRAADPSGGAVIATDGAAASIRISLDLGLSTLRAASMEEYLTVVVLDTVKGAPYTSADVLDLGSVPSVV